MIPLATVIMSGMTAKVLRGKRVAGAPNPVITSSKMSRMPCLSQMAPTSRCIHRGTSTPVDPRPVPRSPPQSSPPLLSDDRLQFAASGAPCWGLPAREEDSRQCRAYAADDRPCGSSCAANAALVYVNTADRDPAEAYAMVGAV